MKKIIYYFLTISIALTSCTKSLQLDISSVAENNKVFSRVALETQGNNVSMCDVFSIVERDFPQSKSAEVQFEVTPYMDAASDTLMYIVNYKNGGGWKIYSSDKRTPAILAEGDAGYFSLEEGSPAVAVWISCVAEEIARVRKSTDTELTFSEDEIQFNKAFWTGQQPRFIGDPVPDDLLIGHWEEIEYSQTIEYDHVDHMVAQWDQDAPYNQCCPYYVSTPGDRAVAGCVAIAGSQLLLYLHNKIGIPANIYSEGYCIGDTDGYEQYFMNSNSTVWSSMSTIYTPSSSTTLPEAIMIGYVGMTVNMHYCDGAFGQYSWALPSNLKTELFENLGISCSRGSYDENIVKTSLLNQMPVIVSASDLMIPIDGDIHCFVIDGYRRTCTKYTHYHYFVLDEIPSGPYMMPKEYNTYTYSSPQLTSIKINWGWSSQWYNTPVNDGWYSLTGGWTVTNGGTYNYNHNRNMTYGFAVAE